MSLLGQMGGVSAGPTTDVEDVSRCRWQMTVQQLQGPGVLESRRSPGNESRLLATLCVELQQVLVTGLLPRPGQRAAFFTSALIFLASASVRSVSAHEVGHIVPWSRAASSLKPNVA